MIKMIYLMIISSNQSSLNPSKHLKLTSKTIHMSIKNNVVIFYLSNALADPFQKISISA